jgi:hypothetical protein
MTVLVMSFVILKVITKHILAVAQLSTSTLAFRKVWVMAL